MEITALIWVMMLFSPLQLTAGESLVPDGPIRRISAWILPEKVPAWPGATGAKVRVEGSSYVLGPRIDQGHGNSAAVYRVENRPLAVKLIHPEFANVPGYGDEVQALEALAHTNISHAQMAAHSADGFAIVKRLVEGETAKAILKRGLLSPEQKSALAGLAAQLIAIGYTADLGLPNLVWEGGSHWTLVDAGGFKFARPEAVLSQTLRLTSR